MNKPLIISGIVVICLVGIIILPKYFKIPECVGNECATNTVAGWKTFKGEQGVTFQYPDRLSTTYIAIQEWPPIIQVEPTDLNCSEPTRIINGRTYCVTSQSEGAAGSVYTTYRYSTSMPKGETVLANFALRAVQCGNYSDTEKLACEEERSSFNLDTLIDQIMSTVKKT